MTGLDPRQDYDHARIAAAPVSTRRILQLGRVALILPFLVVLLAFWLKATLTVGIHTHPPFWLLPLAHVCAVIGALSAGYFLAYISVARAWRKAAVGAALCYAFTFFATAWALPSLSVFVAATPVTLEAEVHRGWKSTHRRSIGCRYNVSFGPWYAPGGSACVSTPAPSGLTGSILQMQGSGNAWATRITRVDAVYSGAP